MGRMGSGYRRTLLGQPAGGCPKGAGGEKVADHRKQHRKDNSPHAQHRGAKTPNAHQLLPRVSQLGIGSTGKAWRSVVTAATLALVLEAVVLLVVVVLEAVVLVGVVPVVVVLEAVVAVGVLTYGIPALRRIRAPDDLFRVRATPAPLGPRLLAVVFTIGLGRVAGAEEAAGPRPMMKAVAAAMRAAATPAAIVSASLLVIPCLLSITRSRYGMLLQVSVIGSTGAG